MNRATTWYADYGGLLVGAIALVLSLATFGAVLQYTTKGAGWALLLMGVVIGWTFILAALVGEVVVDD